MHPYPNFRSTANLGHVCNTTSTSLTSRLSQTPTPPIHQHNQSSFYSEFPTAKRVHSYHHNNSNNNNIATFGTETSGLKRTRTDDESTAEWHQHKRSRSFQYDQQNQQAQQMQQQQQAQQQHQVWLGKSKRQRDDTGEMEIHNQSNSTNKRGRGRLRDMNMHDTSAFRSSTPEVLRRGNWR